MTIHTPRALALVGMPGSGKTVCAQHLDRQGYYTFRFGQIVVDEVARRGWVLNPENERIVREEFRQQEGINAIARRALPYLKSAMAERPCIVIDGLYGFGEYKLLQEELPGTMAVVAIVSERSLRYQRLAERPERPLTPTEAAARDYAEIENLEKGGPIAIADFTLLNNGSPGDLLAALDVVVARLDFRAQ
jgi:dephospho-CoA kinase